MVQCQNCGEVNNYGSNFCRFCGTRMIIPQNAQEVERQPEAPSRPYIWKTDEFPASSKPAARPQEIRRVEPLQPQNYRQNQSPPMPPNFRPPAPLAHAPYQSPAHQTAPYRCPNCGTHYFPQAAKKISTAGWVVFGVLLFAFFPLCWIGLLVKDEVRICPVCRVKVI